MLIFGFCLKNLRESNLWWLLDLLSLSVDFHLLERNDELSQFLSLCKRHQSHAVWYSYSLFCDQNCCSVREMWQGECIRSVIRMFKIFRGLSAEWNSYKLSEISNKSRILLSVLQAQNTHKLPPKNMHILITALPKQINWLQQITTGQTVSDRTHSS